MQKFNIFIWVILKATLNIYVGFALANNNMDGVIHGIIFLLIMSILDRLERIENHG